MGRWMGGGVVEEFCDYLNGMCKFSCFELENNIKILVFL